jgi:hypothetical protein
MSQNWYLFNKSRNKMDDDTPSTSTVQSDNLSAIERFVREVIGNLKDAWLNRNKPVKGLFSFFDLIGEDKMNFINNVKLHELQGTYSKICEDPEKISRIFLDHNPADLFNPEKLLRILIIRDENTKGLIGPEWMSPEYIGQDDLRFLGLCRSIGKNSQSTNQDSIGSWGYGKSVIWSNNISRSVLFNSMLSEPWDENGTEINNRFIGHTMVPDFFNEEVSATSGEIYFGDQKNEDIDEVTSLWNNEAIEFGAGIGVSDFELENPGTAIMIIGFEPNDGDEYDTETIVNQFKSAIEKYYWPAIESDELEIQLKLNNEIIPIDIMSNTSIKPFVRLYRKVLENPTNDPKFKLIDAKGPRLKPADGKIAIYAKEMNEGLYLNRIAKIRGTKMVIEYANPRISNLSGTGAIGVAMTGTLINELNNVDSSEQKKIDEVLKISEPISHHKWDERNEKLKRYQGSGAIKKINVNIHNAFKNMIRESKEERSGEHSTLLAKLFKLEGGGIGPPPRQGETTYSVLINMERIIEGSDSSFEHQIAFTTKSKSTYKRIEGNLQPTHISIDTNFRVVDDEGKALPKGDTSDLIHFKPVELIEHVCETDDYDTPIQTNTIPVNNLQEPLKLDQYFRKYEVKWLCQDIPNHIAELLIIRPVYKWKIGREE